MRASSGGFLSHIDSQFPFAIGRSAKRGDRLDHVIARSPRECGSRVQIPPLWRQPYLQRLTSFVLSWLSIFHTLMDRYLRKVPATQSETEGYGDDPAGDQERPLKRVRLSDESHPGRDPESDVPDDEDNAVLNPSVEAPAGPLGDDDGTKDPGFESALPETRPDEAVGEYEAASVSQIASGDSGPAPPKGLWVKGRRSIYVDAFNLALDTVLEDEAHLFDERERHVFGQWKALSYESQYLCVIPLEWRTIKLWLTPVLLVMSACF